ncbi:MAG: putative tricarboxylic transport rane protein [Thermomicrobiales bacterium]|nr:putative tricarboxylic transport rane protein [Thermomicrobiales bacterium]
MDRGSPESSRFDRYAELALAVGVLVLGALVLWKTTEIRLTPVNSRVGPRVIPYIVGGGLVLTGCWLALDVLRGRVARPSAGEDDEDADSSLPTDWAKVGMLAASLVAYLLLIERAGFIIASAVLFFVASFGMGSRRILRDVIVALLLSVGAYVLFTKGLSLRLPKGWLDFAVLS